MWPLFATIAAYAVNTFASEALTRLSPFQLVFLSDPPDLTSLSFPKIDTIPVKYRGYYNIVTSKSPTNWQTIIRMENQTSIRIQKQSKEI